MATIYKSKQKMQTTMNAVYTCAVISVSDKIIIIIDLGKMHGRVSALAGFAQKKIVLRLF